MHNKSNLAHKVTNNFTKIRLDLLLYPALLFVAILFLLFSQEALTVNGYVNIQKNLFFFLNGKLAEFPTLQFNLTQLGDALILFPLLTIFIVYAPKIWGVLISSAIVSVVVSFLLKIGFAVPRPAAMFNQEDFNIIGETLVGSTSLPSGHSITTFTVITLLLFALMPKELKYKILWSTFMLGLGLIIAFSRVGVGAHYPLDVLIGSSIGYSSTLICIVINNKFSWWEWIKQKKYYPIFMLLLTICIFAIVKEILVNNLLIFYLSLLAIITTLLLMIKIYVKKEY
jgi:membrane-associated phospholipid phosphatase